MASCGVIIKVLYSRYFVIYIDILYTAVVTVLTFHQQQALLQLSPRKLGLFGFLWGQVPHTQGPQPTKSKSNTLTNKYEDNTKQIFLSSLLLSQEKNLISNTKKKFLLVDDSCLLVMKDDDASQKRILPCSLLENVQVLSTGNYLTRNDSYPVASTKARVSQLQDLFPI